MAGFVYLLIAFAFLLTVFPAALGGLRNARGIFIAYCLSGIFIPSLLAINFGTSNRSYIISLSSDFAIKALILSSFAFIIVVFVSVSIERMPIKLRGGKIFKSDARLANIYSTLSFIFTALYLVIMISKFGGVGQMVSRLYERVNFNDSGANFAQTLTQASFIFSIFAYTFSRGLRGFSKIYALASVSSFLAFSFVLGGRLFVGLFFVAIFYLPFIKMKISRASVMSVIALFLFSTVSYVMLILRTEAQGGRSRSGDFSEIALTGLTFVDHIAASIEYASRYGLDYGRLYLNILTTPIPRDWWPQKPLPMSIILRRFIFGDEQGGVPPGIFGEGYLSFGSFGVVMMAGVLGILIAWVNNTTKVAMMKDCRVRIALAGIFAPLVSFALVRGGFDVGTNRLLVSGFFSLVAIALANQFRAYDRIGRGGLVAARTNRRRARAFMAARGRIKVSNVGPTRMMRNNLRSLPTND